MNGMLSRNACRARASRVDVDVGEHGHVDVDVVEHGHADVDVVEHGHACRL